MLRQKEINAYKSRKEAQKDETVTRRKVATFQNTGFAFSQDKGHDIMITDSITNRFQEALKRQMFTKSIFADHPQIVMDRSINSASF